MVVGAAPAAAQDSMRPRTPPGPAERAQLERQLRQRVGRAVQARLQLSDAQMARLQKTNQSFEDRRRALVAEERQIRAGIAEQFAAGDRADQAAVAKLIDSAIGIQRARHDLVGQEQRELASFLTPVQRARYLDLQERLRRRVEELRRGQRRGGAEGRRLAPGAR
jgi:hypothetical protein